MMCFLKNANPLFYKLFKFKRQVFYSPKNSANEQNASLLAGCFSECNLFWCKAIRMFYNFSRERSGLRNREKEENRLF